MELVAVIRVLAAHRIAVVAGVAASILVGLLAAGVVSIFPPGVGSGRADSAAALSRIQVDTLRPLAAESRVKGAETIVPRTRLFALLMSTQDVSDGISARFGVDPGGVAVATAGSERPLEVTPLANEAAAATASRDGLVVTVAADPQVPVISLTTTAPDAGTAARLAEAATDELVELVETKAPGDGIKHVLADPLGAPVVVLESGGPRYRAAIVAGLGVFILWCSGIVLAAGFARSWRRGERSPGGGRARAGAPQQS